jgi:hypothetical protein
MGMPGSKKKSGFPLRIEPGVKDMCQGVSCTIINFQQNYNYFHPKTRDFHKYSYLDSDLPDDLSYVIGINI